MSRQVDRMAAGALRAAARSEVAAARAGVVAVAVAMLEGRASRSEPFLELEAALRALEVAVGRAEGRIRGQAT